MHIYKCTCTCTLLCTKDETCLPRVHVHVPYPLYAKNSYRLQRRLQLELKNSEQLGQRAP